MSPSSLMVVCLCGLPSVSQEVDDLVVLGHDTWTIGRGTNMFNVVSTFNSLNYCMFECFISIKVYEHFSFLDFITFVEFSLKTLRIQSC